MLAVVALVAIDLVAVRARGGVVSAKAAGFWVGLYIALSLGFAGLIYHLGGSKPAVQWVTAYVIEYALSVDNLFVFIVIFTTYKVKPDAQHKLLYWGVGGAFVLRGALIGLGTTLVHRFAWILYFFGAFLIYTGFKLLFSKEEETEVDPEKSPVLKLARKVLPLAHQDHGKQFFARENGKFVVTPLLLVLMVVEASDLLFALDSIPAVMGISKDPFIIFTSNVAAVMGLRSLFFVVSSLMDKFHYLKVGLGVILAFVGVKLCLETFFSEQVHAHEGLVIAVSLGFIVSTLVISILASILKPKSPQVMHLKDPHPLEDKR